MASDRSMNGVAIFTERTSLEPDWSGGKPALRSAIRAATALVALVARKAFSSV